MIWQISRSPYHSVHELSIGNIAQNRPLAKDRDLDFLTVVHGHQDFLLLLLFNALIVVKVDCDILSVEESSVCDLFSSCFFKRGSAGSRS